MNSALIDLAADIARVLFRKHIDKFKFHSGDLIIKLFRIRRNKKSTLKQRVECTKNLGCLGWIVFILILFCFFYLYSKN